MTDVHTGLDTSAGRLEIPRSRGAATGFLLVVLGLWGALIPFVGPYFDFAYAPGGAWEWTAARGWLAVLPGAVTVVGGLLLLVSSNRAAALLGGWIAVIAGAWFVVGRSFAEPWGLGDIGTPVAGTSAGRIAVELTFFSGLGALIIFLGAIALGRVSVRSLRDIRHAQRPAETAGPVETPEHAVAATAARHRAEQEPDESTHHRSWRDLFKGSRRTPVAH